LKIIKETVNAKGQGQKSIINLNNKTLVLIFGFWIYSEFCLSAEQAGILSFVIKVLGIIFLLTFFERNNIKDG